MRTRKTQIHRKPLDHAIVAGKRSEVMCRCRVVVDSDLLKRVDAFVKANGITRSELFRRGIRTVLAANGWWTDAQTDKR